MNPTSKQDLIESIRMLRVMDQPIPIHPLTVHLWARREKYKVLTRLDAQTHLQMQESYRGALVFNTETYDWKLKRTFGEDVRVYSNLYGKLGW